MTTAAYQLFFEGNLIASNLFTSLGGFGCATIYQISTINRITPSSIKVNGLDPFGISNIYMVKFFTVLCYYSIINFGGYFSKMIFQPVFGPIHYYVLGDGSFINRIFVEGEKVEEKKKKE